MSEKKQLRVNGEIRVPQVRLVGADGEQIGIVSLEEANRQSLEAGLDLVEISPRAEPPVCKIMDHGKFLFEEKKKQNVAKKNQKQIQIKEIKFRPGTDEGDYRVKMNSITRFLKEGNKVKITVRFRGREMAHQELGMEMMKRIEGEVAEIAVIEYRPQIEGRQMVMVIAPKK